MEEKKPTLLGIAFASSLFIVAASIIGGIIWLNVSIYSTIQNADSRIVKDCYSRFHWYKHEDWQVALCIKLKTKPKEK